jgi:hypothetical protein
LITCDIRPTSHDGAPEPTEHPHSPFGKRSCVLIRERPEIFKVLFSDDLAKAGPEEAATRVRQLKHDSMTTVLSLLCQAKEQGVLAEGADPDELVYVVHGTALAIVFSGGDLEQVTSASVDPEQVWEALEALMRKS